ncbi:MAG: DUF370 domain-containing protein [Clostridia bacterium]|nr:DUF370 domain-containing protein [Clostridia bacterium]
MYVHLGGEITVTSDSVVAVIDLENVSALQADFNKYIRAEDDSNRLEYISGDISKSLVITTNRTYVSPMSSGVLLKRLTMLQIQ